MNLNRKRLVFISRLLVIITIAYIMLLGPGKETLRYWGYGFIAFYLTTNLIVYYLPERFFASSMVYYCIVLVDCLLVVGGIYLSGMEGSDLYLAFFVIVCLATLGSEFKNLIIASCVFVIIYGWMLYQQGFFQGEMAVSYCLRLPFIMVVTLFLGYIVDIQTRDQKERLKKSEKRYRSFVENLPIGVYQQTASEESKFSLMNKAFLDLFGYKAKQMLEGTADVIYPNREEQQELWRNLERGNKIEGYALDLRRRDGTVFNANMWARKYIYEAEEIIEGVIIDVTKLKKAEKALAESEERLRLAGKASYDLVYEYQVADNRLRWFGDVDVKLGYDAGDVSQNQDFWQQLIHPSDSQKRDDAEAFQTGTEVNACEYRIKHRDGTWRYWSEHRLPVSDEAGNIVKWIGVCTDITKNKEMEYQLQQAQKMEAIGVLAGGVAHNFNNMLMGIMGHVSDLLADRTAYDADYEQLKSVASSIKEAASLTKNLLGFARGGAYEVLPFNLNDLIVKENHIFRSANKNIRIQEELDEHLWVVEADKSQIQQVIINLYLNSAQAMYETGSGEISVQTENVLLSEKHVQPYRLQPGKYVKISVEDNGSGIDEQTLKKIFEPFFTSKKQGEGTGLGLSSVYGIIKNHMGFIEVESEVGSGTTFFIYLPASDKNPAAVDREKTALPEIAAGSGTILIVDDEEMVIKSCARLLKRLKFNVLSVQDGESAINLYKQRGNEIDLVMLDMLMPDMSGRVVFEKIKGIDPNVKVLLSSGFSMNDQTKDILAKGCNGFIQKPFDIDELAKKINEIINNAAD